MSGTNPLATYAISDYTSDTATTYKTKIDANSIVAERIISAFAANQQATANMTVTVDPGSVLAGTTLTEVGAYCQLTTNSTTTATVDDATGISNGMVVVAAGVPANTTITISGTTVTLSNAATASATVTAKFQQVTGTITAPSGNPRIDRIVGDRLTGAISVITGTPAATPTPPAITSGKFPIAKVLLQTTSTSITNSMLYDERTPQAVGRGLAGELNLGAWVKNDGSNNLTLKTNATLFDDGSGNLTTGMTTEATLASAATTDLGTAASNIVKITGTTTITSFGSSASTADPIYITRFTGALTLTYNATSLILPGSANYTTAAGDVFFWKYEGSGNWRCVGYALASGAALSSPTNLIKTVKVQTFPSSGTYMPSAGMVYCFARGIGGGGAGGGVPNSHTYELGDGGAAGSYSERILTAAQIGASQAVTIGAAGNGSTGNGPAGGSTSLGTLLVCNGGNGGLAQNATASNGNGSSASGGAAGTGDLAIPGNSGGPSWWVTASPWFFFSGAGANSQWGNGGALLVQVGTNTGSGSVGNAGHGYGAGGSGAKNVNGAGAENGGSGSPGYLIIIEYCTQ